MKFFNGALSSLFNKKATDQQLEVELPKTDFCAYLEEKFGHKTAVGVIESFQKMGLPPPQKKEEFLDGTEGGLVFLNKYGLVLRIEKTDTHADGYSVDRIDNSAWIVKPLATINAGAATIEIIPGTHLEKEEKTNKYMIDNLRKENISFFDSGIRNLGRLPIKTPSFPEGVPVVIDRLAVRKLSDSIKPVQQALTQEVLEAVQAQETLYGPLKKAFENAGMEPQKMQQFFKLCEQNVKEGKLVAGWNEYQIKSAFIDDEKSSTISNIAKKYEVSASAQTVEQKTTPKVAVTAKSRFQP